MARPGSSALRAEIARLTEQAEIAETLETAQGQLSQAQAELAGVQQQVAVARTTLLAEEAALRQKQQAITDAQKILEELHGELEAKKRESVVFDRIAAQQIKEDRAHLVALVPYEPAPMPAELDRV